MILLFATGEGQRFRPDRRQALSEPYPEPTSAITVWVGGRPAEVLFAAQAPGAVGILQISARIPTIVDAGAVPIALSIGSAISQEGVTVFVR